MTQRMLWGMSWWGADSALMATMKINGSPIMQYAIPPGKFGAYRFDTPVMLRDRDTVTVSWDGVGASSTVGMIHLWEIE